MYFIGECDVCGEAIATKHDPTQGVIDINILEDGRIQTWIRHYATAPDNANPDCAKYSSEVYEVTPPKELIKDKLS